jgi:mxaD protein
MIRIASVAAMTILCGVLGSNAVAKTMTVTRTVEINAPPAKVWALAGDFGGIHNWHPAAKSTTVEGDKEKTGAKRVITLQDGGKIMETQTARAAKSMSMTYIITESVLPVNQYKSTLSARRTAKGTMVKWTGRFVAKKGADDKTALQAITGVYDSGLANLKKVAEQ